VSTDAHLAAGLARGADGLAAVYAAYSAKLYTYALTMLRDPVAAQDVVHDALLAAAGAIGQLRDPERFRPWLYAITRNECLRALRGRSRFSDSDQAIDMPDDSIDFDAGLRRDEAFRLVAQGMAAMNPADRDILSLALQHDLDVERLSQITGAAPNLLHARLSRARSGLSDAVSALLLYRTGGRHCEELAAILPPTGQPLTPLLRKRIQRHVKSCEECGQRRRAALAALGPAMAAPLHVEPPDALRSRILDSWQHGQTRQLAARAAPFDDNGFPVPLDRQRTNRWLLPVAVAGVALVIVGVLLALLPGRDSAPAGQGQPTAVALPSAIAAGSPSPTPSVTASDAPQDSDQQVRSDDDTPEPVIPDVDPVDPAPLSVPVPDSDTARSNSTKQSPSPTPTKATPPPTKSKKPSASPTPAPSDAPQPPVITQASLTNLDVAADGSFTRCDAFTVEISATVSGKVDKTEARITPTDTTVKLSGDPLQATTTLPPGEYSVKVAASGPGGVTTRDAGTILHICPG
jgi:RNA polymerase sigma factor (sigma-70 family)